ncbi:hypothetical protein [Streptomyces naphthomycinicus]|uniref:hypothetical protein n=1 Tax=Streptomyces naphthomycinicus TaxID=2872625 RepID=UPI001CEC43B4|nr:hypothetical protein [Streptomyces sp. TML10]
MPNQRSQGASRRSCDRCGAPVLRQLVGHRAALKVTADAEPIPLPEARALMEPNRLAWCLVTLHSGDPDLRWQCRSKCGHSTVIEHRCPLQIQEFGQKPEGAMW